MGGENLLIDWFGEASWNSTFPFCPIYKSKTTEEYDISLSNLCRKEEELMLGKNGFTQIGYAPIREQIDMLGVHPDYNMVSAERIAAA